MDILDNPLELCGFAFIEFVSTENGLDQIFETIGFTKVAKHKSKKVYLWCQRHSKIDPFYLTNGKVKLTPLISY